MWWLRELSTCLSFIMVSGDRRTLQSKRVYEFLLPTAATILIIVLYIFIPKMFFAGFLSNLTNKIFQFMVFVVPFHLAALGAFATFERAGLDETLKGTNAQIRKWSNEDNTYFYEVLTLRQYASLLFGYLCSIGVMFIVAYIVASNLDFKFVLGDHFEFAYKIVLALVVFFISHYAFLTLYAITFLFDKFNRIGS